MFRPSRLPARRAGFVVLVGLSVVAIAALARVDAGGSDRVGWWDDLPAARRAATAGGGRPMLLDFTADWCPACQELRRSTWSDRSVAAAITLGHVVPVRVDVDAHPDVGRQYAAEYLPLLVLTDANGREVRRSEGYLTPAEFRSWLAGQAPPG